MDYLDRPFTTQVRLRVEPELLATVRWYFAPDGALQFPGRHAFGAACWETDTREYPQPEIGQVDLKYTPDRGEAPPEVTGQGSPTPLPWFRTGVPADVVSSYPNGICGLPAFSDLWAWLRPEVLVLVPDGSPVAVWADSSSNHRSYSQGLQPVPTFLGDAGGGKPGLVFFANDLDQSQTQWLDRGGVFTDALPGTEQTTLMVARFVGTAPSRPFIGLDGAGGQELPRVAPTFVNVRLGNLPITLTAAQPTGLHVWHCRRAGDEVEIGRDGVALLTDSEPAGPTTLLGRVGASPPPFAAGSSIIAEAVIFTRRLLDVELAAWVSYLLANHGEPDVNPPGTILAFAGVGAPAGYLLCDGTAVSRSTYAALYAAIGTTWGVGDGATTFNTPDLRGRSPLGAGSGPGLSARAVADTGGTETHQLVTAELPSHTHGPGVPGSVYVLAGGVGVPVAALGAVVTTSAVVTGATGADTAHPNVHPFRGVLFAIKY